MLFDSILSLEVGWNPLYHSMIVLFLPPALPLSVVLLILSVLPLFCLGLLLLLRVVSLYWLSFESRRTCQYLWVGYRELYNCPVHVWLVRLFHLSRRWVLSLPRWEWTAWTFYRQCCWSFLIEVSCFSSWWRWMRGRCSPEPPSLPVACPVLQYHDVRCCSVPDRGHY